LADGTAAEWERSNDILSGIGGGEGIEGKSPESASGRPKPAPGMRSPAIDEQYESVAPRGCVGFGSAS
jgi:hypothetical protein